MRFIGGDAAHLYGIIHVPCRCTRTQFHHSRAIPSFIKHQRLAHQACSLTMMQHCARDFGISATLMPALIRACHAETNESTSHRPIAQGCAASKPEGQPEPTLVKNNQQGGNGAAPEHVKPEVRTSNDGGNTNSERRHTEQKRRRVAVASENAEVLASVRWHSAFDAIRRPEEHSFAQTAQILTGKSSHWRSWRPILL